ncbi:MAG: response regulator [Deltaproteobacteria bacterium]|jgi:CheY-like chemotaxis protein|nr:response regulator [Deltaproteobacteria bacterium]
MCSILVIDDEKGILRVLREALTRSGHRVEIAEDGYEGIQKFDGGGFDIVITDMRMPGLDGESVARHIRRSPHKAIPVIGISGTPWLLKENNFDLVLPKPFPLQELIDSVSRLITIPSKAAARA